MWEQQTLQIQVINERRRRSEQIQIRYKLRVIGFYCEGFCLPLISAVYCKYYKWSMCGYFIQLQYGGNNWSQYGGITQLLYDLTIQSLYIFLI